MYKETISYEDKLDLMADMWVNEFNEELLTEDKIKDFHLDCRAYEVNVIDVLLVMQHSVCI